MKTNAGPEAVACVGGPQRWPHSRLRCRLAGQLGVLVPLALGAMALAPPSHAQGYADRQGRLGLVAEADIEYGGDDIVSVYYTNNTSTKISAGQGVALALGAHYRPRALPIDFAATVGYKFIGTEDRNSNLGLYRVVVKLTGTYMLPQQFWVDAGPVWHTATKLKGDGFLADIPFDDALGVTAGIGWRFVGVSYTHIRYRSPQLISDVDASNIGVNLVFKF
jgi:hypothetical protein